MKAFGTIYKTAALVCALSMLLGLWVMPAGAQTWREDFPAGGTLDGAWTLTVPQGGTLETGEIDGVSALHFSTQSGFSSSDKLKARYTLPQALKGVVELEYRAKKTTNHTFCAPYVYSASDALLVSTMFATDYKLKTYTGGSYQALCDYNTSDWYTVTTILNCDTGRFSVKINGEFVIEDTAFRSNGDNVSYMEFYVERGGAEAWLDYVEARQISVPAVAEVRLFDASNMDCTEAERIPCDLKSVQITFSEAMKEESLEEAVTLVDTASSEAVSYTAALSGDGTVYTLTLDEILAEDASYTLHIGGDAENTGGVTMEQPVSRTFHTQAGGFTVNTVSVVDGAGKTYALRDGMGNIPVDIRGIKFTFNQEIDPDSVSDANASVKNSAEETVSNASAEGAVLTLQIKDTLQHLEAYTALVWGIVSVGGVPLRQEVQVRFRTEREALYREGFEGYEEESDRYGLWEVKGGTARTAYDPERGSDVLVIDKPAGDRVKYEVAATFPGSGEMSEEIVVLEYNIKAPRSANMSAPYLYASNGTVLFSSLLNSGGNITVNNASTAQTIGNYEENQWNHVKIAWNRSTETFNYIFNGVLLAKEFDMRNKVSASDGYTVSFYMDAARSGRVMIDDVAVYLADAPTLLEEGVTFLSPTGETASPDAVPGDAEKIRLAFSEDVYLSDSGVVRVLSAKDFAPPVIGKTAVTAPGILEAEVLGGFLYDTEYSLEITGLHSSLGRPAEAALEPFRTGPNPLSITQVQFNGGLERVPQRGAVTGAFRYANEGAPQRVKVIAGAFDKDGVLTDSSVKSAVLSGTGNIQAAPVEASGGSIRLYLWKEDFSGPAVNSVFVLSDTCGVEITSKERGRRGGAQIVPDREAYSAGYPQTALSLSGSHSEQGAKSVSLLVLKQGYDLEQIPEGNAASVIAYLAQGAADETGAFDFTYPLGGEIKTGDYMLYFGGENVDSPEEVYFSYVGRERLDELVAEVAQSRDSAETFAQTICRLAGELDIPCALLAEGDIKDSGYVEFVTELKDTIAYDGYDSFRQTYLEAYFTGGLSYTDSKYGLIAGNLEYFGLSKESPFSAVMAEEATTESFVNTLWKGAAFQSRAEAAEKFKTAVALCGVSTAGRGNMTARLEAFADIFDISTGPGSVYGRFSLEQKAKVAMKLVSPGGYKTVRSFQTAFNAAVAAVADEGKDEGTPSKKPSQGSSGGGGSSMPSGNNIITVEPKKEPENKAEQEFRDVLRDSWYYEYIGRLAEREIINGFEDGTFRPEAYVTRGEFIKMIITAVGKYDGSAQCGFTDCGLEDWFTPYVASAEKIGMVSGFEDRTIRPGAQITRQDAAVMVFGAVAGASGQGNVESTAFADDGAISAYAKEAVYYLAQAKVISGMGDEKFEPLSFLTRAQAAKIICAACGL